MKHYYNNTPQDYSYIQVEYEAPLLEYLLKNVKMSRNKIKDTLQEGNKSWWQDCHAVRLSIKAWNETRDLKVEAQ